MSALTFSSAGQMYRIVFQHDRPRNWNAHGGHLLSFHDYGFDKGPCKSHKAVWRLYCDTCKCALAGISPEIGRALKTLSVHIARELARNVRCTIFKLDEAPPAPLWIVVHTGRSKLNTDAGDRYTREEGRMAALRAALPKPPPGPGEDTPSEQIRALETARQRCKTFNCAAMSAYQNRATRKATA